MKRNFLSSILILCVSIAFSQTGDKKMQISSEGDSMKITIDGVETTISNEDMAQYYLQEGLVLASGGDYAGAEQQFRLALLYDLDNSEILYNLGLAQYYEKAYDEAITTFDAAAEIAPDNVDIYNQRGLCKALLGNYSGSETDFKIMMKYDPDFPMGNYNYGILLLETGSTENGCELLHKANDLGYNNAASVIATYCNE